LGPLLKRRLKATNAISAAMRPIVSVSSKRLDGAQALFQYEILNNVRWLIGVLAEGVSAELPFAHVRQPPQTVDFIQ
jgi:hypothetical protein